MRDLDDAYANSKYIPDGEGYYADWEARAAAFRDGHVDKALAVAYGTGARQTYDMYHPDGPARGTVVFVHGGYWMAGSTSMFSHLARGAVMRGMTCAMVGHTLAPDARIGDIVGEVADATSAIAHDSEGPMYLVGHSAGGHLVARMVCADQVAEWSPRVARVMAISPIGDLAPLMQTTMNDTLGLDAAQVLAQSPIHHARQGVPVTVWVGSEERPVFLDQAIGLANAWDCDLTIDPGRHHFDVIEGLEDPTSAMMRALLRTEIGRIA